MEHLNDPMAKVLNLVTLVVIVWPGWGSVEKREENPAKVAETLISSHLKCNLKLSTDYVVFKIL